MDIELFRYISFENFVNLVINNKDRYVRPSSWDDRLEGYLFSHMETPEDVRQIVSEMYYKLCLGNYFAIPDNYFRMWHSKWFTYAQCWTSHKDADAMWRCNSYNNKAIQIRTTYDKLYEHASIIFPKEQSFSVYLRKVCYDLDKESAVDLQISQMKDSLLAHETYFHKRPAFEHEDEYRLLVADNKLFDVESLSSYGVKREIKKYVNGKTDEEIISYLTRLICDTRVDWKEEIDKEDVKIVDAGDISLYLEGVMVHPLAKQWYVDIVQEICQSKNIVFDGQSTLYTLD